MPEGEEKSTSVCLGAGREANPALRLSSALFLVGKVCVDLRDVGEIVSTGTVKIGAGSVIIGNISASSSSYRRSCKGRYRCSGPVVVDTSAVIMGNIKSRSVQINNGAVIEGFCSQTYCR